MENEQEIDLLYPKIREQVKLFLVEAKKFNAYLFCGYRSFDEQDKLYAQGRSIPGGIITNAYPGYSAHNYGLAVDVVFKNNHGWTWDSNDWEKLGRLGDKYGLVWGGSWGSFIDKPHFEQTYHLDLTTLKNIYLNREEVKDVWAFISSETKGG